MKILQVVKKYNLVLLLIFYFITRVFHLTTIPIFNDESIYIRYGLHERLEEVSQHYSLLIGKEPLMPNLYAISGLLFNNLLFGARLVTVIFGFLTLLGVYKFCKKYFSKKIALTASFLYIICPFILFFDRLALMDSPVSTIAIWSLYFALRLLEIPNIKNALILGGIVGVGFWTKSTSYFYFFLPIIALIFYSVKNKKVDIEKAKFFSISSIVALFIFSLLYFDPLFKNLVEQRKIYSYGFSFIFTFPIEVWRNNILQLFYYFFFLQTPVIFIFGLIGSILLFKKAKPESYFFLFWYFIPMLYMILYGRMPTSRYFLVFSVFFIISSSILISKLLDYKKYIGFIALAMIVGICSFYNFLIYLKPFNFQDFLAGPAKADIHQYFHGFASGYGVNEAISYLKEEARAKPIIVIIRNDSGNPEDAVAAYLYYNNPNIKVLPINEPDLKNYDLLKNNLPKDIPIYFVSRGAYYVGLEKYFISEKKFLKPDDKEFVGIQRLNVN